MRSLFSLPGIPSLPPVQGPPGLPDLDDQRRLIARARRESVRWLLRGVVMIAIAALAVRRGWTAFGLVFAALALLGLGLARSTSRRARELEAKLALLEKQP